MSNSICLFSKLKIAAAASLFFVLGTICSSQAALLATATTSANPVGPVFDYTLTLNNTGTTNIGTFWFSWIPGQDFMTTSPTNISSSLGWSPSITGGDPGNGYAILWAGGTPLAAGSSATFSFTSSMTPSQMAGNSTFHPASPVETSFVYIGAAFGDPGYQFVAAPAPVPEPGTSALLMIAGVGALVFGLRRHLAFARQARLNFPTSRL